jgi:nucleotide-binding universal stress UspA family protein
MEASEKTILVTWDFSNVSEYALQHAIRAAKIIDSNVTLLHITAKEKENVEAERRLQIVLDEATKKYDFTPNYIIKEGSIFSTISEVANELCAIFVVMGTHGIKGMQKITGSWALKVIAGTKVPFLVVQKPPKDSQLEVIAYPIDYKKEDKQKSVWAVYLHKYFKSKIHILVEKSTDSSLAKQIHNNVIFTKNIFDNQGIEYDVEEALGQKDFSEEVIDFAQKINANAILITTSKKLEVTDYMFGATEQQVIANKESISVMCVNPKEGKFASYN